ncbi:MAG TPA: MMPL family transporter [Humisphaera sp.]|jgi:hypothetical protein|nr:MMPL family transporter [Humisphaera sp.]
MPAPTQRRSYSSRPIERRILLAVLWIVDHPRVTLLSSGILLAICLAAAMLRLSISSDQNKLFSQRDPNFKAYLNFDKQFPENEAVYVIVESVDPNSSQPVERWTSCADAIGEQIRKQSQYVKSVDLRVPVKELGAQGVLFSPPAALAERFQQIRQLARLAQLWGQGGANIGGGISIPGVLTQGVLGRTPIERFLSGARLAPMDDQTVGFIKLLTDHWNKTLDDPSLPIAIGSTVPDLSALGATTPEDLGYYFRPDAEDKSQKRHLLLVRVYPKADYSSLTSITDSVAAIRLAAHQAAANFPEFKIGVTGRPALAADEMKTTDRDSHRAEILAMVAVFIGLVAMLRSIWLALAAEICLAVGIGWTFGWATFSVGELNLLSIVFLIALIGIGMDYLVQVLMRYRAETQRHARPRAAWVRVFRHVAAPINTACLGAAGAFLVSLFTDFRGAAELGIIAGGGLILCLLTGYTVLPAMLTILPSKAGATEAPKPFRLPPRRGPIRLLFPAIWAACLLALTHFMPAKFNPNLLELQAPNVESTKLVRKLQTWVAAVLSKDLNELRRARDAVAGLQTVGSTDSLLTALDNHAWLTAHQSELPTIQWTTPPAVGPADLSAISSKASALAEALLQPQSMPTTSATRPLQTAETADALRHFAQALKAAPPEQAGQRLSQWQEVFVSELHEMLAQFSPRPFDLQQVPAELREHLVSADGTYALYIYPKNDLWDRANLSKFVKSVENAVATKVSGSLNVTGIAPNIYHTTAAVHRSFFRATIYALALIFVLVLIDLRDIRQTLLAVSVLGMGLPMLVGLMGLFNVEWNFANFFGLPILIGAGHEYGVFMIHRYRETLRDPRRVWQSWDVADRALLLCAYVTCSSFAFFWALANHKGLKSLGLVMAMGTACIYLSTVMVLRPLLKWRLERRNAQ